MLFKLEICILVLRLIFYSTCSFLGKALGNQRQMLGCRDTELTVDNHIYVEHLKSPAAACKPDEHVLRRKISDNCLQSSRNPVGGR